jgi:hypothetical protein
VFWWLFYGAGAGILIFLMGTTAYGMTVGYPASKVHSGRSGKA